MRVFKRAGHPLLVIPRDLGVPGRFAMGLYAPQTFMARLARQVWRWSLPVGFCPGSCTEQVQINPASPFVRFLSDLAGAGARTRASRPADALPPFTLLVGNPYGVAPRFILQVFDSASRPFAVVKAGIGKEAMDLVDREAGLLERLAFETHQAENTYIGIPRIVSRFAGDNIHAFAMPFVAGKSPRLNQKKSIEPILRSWLDKRRSVRICELPAWKRLQLASAKDPLFKNVNDRLSQLKVVPALFHGDFAPWNIRVCPSSGFVTVLDWERGELEGPPVWDWLHYIVQTATLAERRAGADFRKCMEQAIYEESFIDYVGIACAGSCPRDWLVSYLLHCRDVLRPGEGAPEVEAALADMSGSPGPSLH